jgi:uncharacterized coiled-coil protein SlyX
MSFSLLELLENRGIKYETLSTAEKDTLQEWSKALVSKELTLLDVKDHIRALIEGVERELASYNLDKNQDLFLKARLKNYLMISDFLTGPEKAKKYIEQSLQNLKPNN